MPTFYDLLGVTPSAEPELIKAAFRAKMRLYHPDTNGGASREAESKAQALNEAYETLRDPQSRADYDERLGIREHRGVGTSSDGDHTNEGHFDPPVHSSSSEGEGQASNRTVPMVAISGLFLVLIALVAWQTRSTESEAQNLSEAMPSQSTELPAATTTSAPITEPKFAEVSGGQEGFAWWIRDIALRPRSNELSGIGLDEINHWRTKNFDRIPSPYCFVQKLDRSSYFSRNPTIQNEIDSTLDQFSEDPFRLTFSPTPGLRFTAQAAAYQTCDGEEGTLVLITNEVGKLVSVTESAMPFRVLFRTDNGTVSYQRCLMCDDYNVAYFDPTVGSIRWEYEGL